MQEQHFITLPAGALPYEGGAPNGVLFPERHSEPMSTPGDEGASKNNWFILRSRSGLSIPRFTTQETVQRETGAFQGGATTVLLKPPSREWSMDIAIRGNDRLDYLLNREKFGYLFSWDLATTETVSPSATSSPYNKPLPWTYTFIRGDGKKFHLDFVVARDAGGLDDVNSPTTTYTETTLSLTSDEPTLYGDEIVIFDTFYRPTIDYLGTFYAGPTFPSPSGAQIKYNGTARATYELEIRPTAVPILTPLNPLYSVSMIEDPVVAIERFQYVDYALQGWVYTAPPIPDPATERVVFNTKDKFLLYQDDVNGVLQKLQLTVSEQTDWSIFQFHPGKSYRFFVETGDSLVDPITVTLSIKLTYRERFAGI